MTLCSKNRLVWNYGQRGAFALALRAEMGFDYMEVEEINQFLRYLESLILRIIKGDTLVSAIISSFNNEDISNYPFSKEYEGRYISWVMERF